MPVDRSCAAGWDRSKVILYIIYAILIYIYTVHITSLMKLHTMYVSIYMIMYVCRLCNMDVMWCDVMGWVGVGWGGMWCIVHIDLHHDSNERLRPKGCADPQEDAEKVSPARTSPRLRHLISLACHTRCGQPWLPLTTTSIGDGKHM
jgi:hypothetical protein